MALQWNIHLRSLGKMIKLAHMNKLDTLYCNVSLTIKNKKELKINIKYILKKKR
jgi:hypothetical protein